MSSVLHPDIWLAFLTLTALEIVLGIDNLIFLSILSNKLPKEQQATARRLGLFFAMFTRIGLLFSLTWFMGFTQPLFSVYHVDVSVRGLVLIIGGLFLITKSTLEIHSDLQPSPDETERPTVKQVFPSLTMTIVQIAIVDIVFSLDSVITAVGLVNHLEVMVAAIVTAMIVMVMLSDVVSGFVDRNPTIKVLALSFLITIGIALVGDGIGIHLPKGMLYFAMAYSLTIECINIKMRNNKAMT